MTEYVGPSQADFDNAKPEKRTKRVNGSGIDEALDFKPETITLGKLLSEETKEPEWIIEGLLPPGVTILGGRPKIGKSRAAAMLAEGVSQDKAVFGRDCRAGTVIYLDLENAKWRISKRWRAGEFSVVAPDRLQFILRWRRGNRAALVALMDGTPDLRLIVIDVWIKFRAPHDPRQQAYDQDYAEISWLQEAAAQRGIAILPVHHLRKTIDPENPFDAISGSVGVFGAVDNAMLLLKHEDGFKLLMQGRDVEDCAFALRGCGLRFDYLGELDPTGSVVTSAEKRYLRALEKEPLAGKTIAQALGVTEAAVSKALAKLANEEFVRHDKRFGWTLSAKGRSALLL